MQPRAGTNMDGVRISDASGARAEGDQPFVVVMPAPKKPKRKPTSARFGRSFFAFGLVAVFAIFAASSFLGEPLGTVRHFLAGPPPRLVVMDQSGPPNEPLRLGIAIEHASGDETVMIGGLTESTELSLGTFAAASGWLVAARDVGDTFVGAPKDFVGVMEATVSLHARNGRLLDQQALRLEWRRVP